MKIQLVFHGRYIIHLTTTQFVLMENSLLRNCHATDSHSFLDLLIVILQCNLECLKYADCELVKKEKAFTYFAVYESWTNINFKILKAIKR